MKMNLSLKFGTLISPQELAHQIQARLPGYRVNSVVLWVEGPDDTTATDG